jgi:hypothetical protein
LRLFVFQHPLAAQQRSSFPFFAISPKANTKLKIRKACHIQKKKSMDGKSILMAGAVAMFVTMAQLCRTALRHNQTAFPIATEYVQNDHVLNDLLNRIYLQTGASMSFCTCLADVDRVLETIFVQTQCSIPRQDFWANLQQLECTPELKNELRNTMCGVFAHTSCKIADITSDAS